MLSFVAALVLALKLEPVAIHALVAQRSELRASRSFKEADAVKAKLEAAGVQLQDEVGGSTAWSLATTAAPAGPSVSVLALAKLAESQPSIVEECCQQVRDSGEDGFTALLGRKAADAAFSFALAGAHDEFIYDELALQQGREFGRWRKAQPLATLQACERLAAAGIAPQHACFTAAASALETGNATVAAAAVRSLRFGSTRSLLWLWRRD